MYGGIKIYNEFFSASDWQQHQQEANQRLQSLGSDYFGQYSDKLNEYLKSLSDFLIRWFDQSKSTLSVSTSGTTGIPKIYEVQRQHMLNSARLTMDFLGLKEGDIAHLCLPLQFIAGQMVVVRAIERGLNLIPVAASGAPLQDLVCANKEVPCFSAMVPLQVYESLREPRQREYLQNISHLIIGGGAVDEYMGAELKAFPNNVWSTYGMTETLSHIALRRLSGKQASEWYSPFESVKLSRDSKECLVIEAPQVCDMVLVTRDRVEFNEQGQFKVLGRVDNIINSGGYKLQIEEIEQDLAKSAKQLGLQLDLMVTSRPDSKFGMQVVMLVQGQAKHEQIKKLVAPLKRYSQPKAYAIVESLPRTDSGKLSRIKALELAKGELVPLK